MLWIPLCLWLVADGSTQLAKAGVGSILKSTNLLCGNIFLNAFKGGKVTMQKMCPIGVCDGLQHDKFLLWPNFNDNFITKRATISMSCDIDM